MLAATYYSVEHTFARICVGEVLKPDDTHTGHAPVLGLTLEDTLLML